MSKWAEVVISIHKKFAVEISDDEKLVDAENYAISEAMEDGAEIVSSHIAKSDVEAGSIIRHSCEVLTK